MDQWEYHVSGYYGPGGRKGTHRNPNRGRPGELEGDLAVAVGCSAESTMQAEVAAFKARDDIAVIVVVGPASAVSYERTVDGWVKRR